jgi:SHS2 domain-containing protein
MAAWYRVMSHTADTGIEVSADTWVELLECAATGMCSLMYDPGAGDETRILPIEVPAAEPESLLVDLLSELLYVSEVHDVAPIAFSVRTASPTLVEMDVTAVPAGEESLIGPPIKAVTYHDLEVRRLDDGSWRATVVFDV